MPKYKKNCSNYNGGEIIEVFFRWKKVSKLEVKRKFLLVRGVALQLKTSVGRKPRLFSRINLTTNEV